MIFSVWGKIITKVSIFCKKFSRKNNENFEFRSLTPTSNAENIKIYIDALKWALQNKKDIRNIGLTGPYGAGKSSILKTFQKRHKNKEDKFLNISFASFKKNENFDDKSLREIELKILKQIFYSGKAFDIDKLKIKKKMKLAELLFRTILSLLFIVSAINLFSFHFVQKFMQETFTMSILEYSKWINRISFIIVLFGLGYIIWKIIQNISFFTIKKIKTPNAEIEIQDEKKSLFDSYMNEILYFFEKSKTNVVVIEDFDRFEKPEIFTKLRDINLLINNSERIKTDVVFIYAVRDDLFEDNDRTKFFDFIIPVIPVVNPSNSSEKFRKILSDNNINEISEDLIDNIFLFVNEMRLLNNIINEFLIYEKILNVPVGKQKPLKLDKLLALILYKNLFPQDFSLLNKNEGKLYKKVDGSPDEQVSKKEDKISQRQIALINTLVDGKYIEQDYFEYLSFFYEGSLSSNDREFLINVKGKRESDFSHRLNKIDNVIKKIALEDFEKPYILNYQLVDFLFAGSPNKHYSDDLRKQFSEKLDKIFIFLKDESKNSIKFIDGFIANAKNIDDFITKLCEHWEGIWEFIETKSNWESSKKKKYLELILENANEDNIIKIFKENKAVLNDKLDIFPIVENHDKLKKIIQNLDLKFSNIDIEKIPNEFFDFILDGGHYQLNPQTIKSILTYTDKFQKENYSKIKDSLLKKFISHIDTLENPDITPILQSLGEEYNKITEKGKKRTITNNELNSKLVEKLQLKKYISKYEVKKQKIQFTTLREKSKSKSQSKSK